jgi:hypothetical protein
MIQDHFCDMNDRAGRLGFPAVTVSNFMSGSEGLMFVGSAHENHAGGAARGCGIRRRGDVVRILLLRPDHGWMIRPPRRLPPPLVVVRERSLSARSQTTSHTLSVVRLVARGGEMGSGALR